LSRISHRWSRPVSIVKYALNPERIPGKASMIRIRSIFRTRTIFKVP